MSDLDLFGRVSTVDTGERSENDFYETPGWMTRSLLHWHPEIRRARVLEPCSGRNAIADVLTAYGCTVSTNDLDLRHPAHTHLDATTEAFWRQIPQVEWVVTNVPFNLAFPILQHAHKYVRNIALLLRVTFMEPTDDRGPWLSAHPPCRHIGLPRYSFRGKGSDSCATDWFIWQRMVDTALQPIVIDHMAESRTRSEV